MPTDWFYSDVNNMVSWGVIEGNDDGTFKPSANVNRAELSAMWNRYDKRVQGLIGGGVNMDTYDQYYDIKFTELDNKIFELQYKLESDNLMDAISDYLDYINVNPSVACSTTNDLYKIHLDTYNSLLDDYSSRRTEFPYIDGNLKTLQSGFSFLKTACKTSGYTL